MTTIKQGRKYSWTFGAALGLSFAAAALLVPAANAGLFSGKPLPAAWNDAAAKADGDGSEWKVDAMTEKDGIEIAAANDERDLYVYVAARDRDTAAQLSGMFKQSFTIWLDPKGTKKKTFGIKVTPEMKRPAGAARQEQPKMGSSRKPAYTAGLVEGEDEEAIPLEGVEFKNGLTRRERPLFELRIPLERLTAKAGDIVGIGIETSKIDESAMPKTEGGTAGRTGRGGARGEGFGPPSGGMPGGGGGEMGGPGGGMMGGGPGGGPGGGGRPGGGSGGQETSLPSPLDFWLKVKLAIKE
ncbi:MAG: hypothetical protein A2X29_06900 [Elusimicrobia bacterium GWA2_64_40]|nr:MAG: hypothetical protein A2X29_06900 [Elusimicrobia bacterium GWA2_64_40]